MRIERNNKQKGQKMKKTNANSRLAIALGSVFVVAILAIAAWSLLARGTNYYTDLQMYRDDTIPVAFLAPKGWEAHSHTGNQIELHSADENEEETTARILVTQGSDAIIRDWAELEPAEKNAFASSVVTDIVDGDFDYNIQNAQETTINGSLGAVADVTVSNSMYSGVMYGRTFISIGPDGRQYQIEVLTSEDELNANLDGMNKIIESWQYTATEGNTEQ